MGKNDDVKNPEQYADREIGKMLGKAIADRKMQIKQHQAAIKKLEKQIQKIKDGELVPSAPLPSFPNSNDEDDEDERPRFSRVSAPAFVGSPTVVRNPQYTYTSSTSGKGVFRRN